jgi:hypothetical protein
LEKGVETWEAEIIPHDMKIAKTSNSTAVVAEIRMPQNKNETPPLIEITLALSPSRV